MASAFIYDGHSTTIDFDVASGVTLTSYFREMQVTPPSMIGGGENDTTTMRNTTWRTKQPKKLFSLGTMTFTASYNPEVYDIILDELLNVNGLITLTFSDGSTYAFYGWVDEFAPDAAEEGKMPTATCTIICSNQTTAGVETDPVFTAAA